MNIQACKKHWHWLWLVFGAGAFFYWCIWIWNPLPSDEEMIESFLVHRADFEEAVRRYREYPVEHGKDPSLWLQDVGTPEVLKRAGISRIEQAYGIIWLPNPYALETAIKARELSERKRGRAPNWLRGYTALTIKPMPNFRLGQLTDERNRFYRTSLIWGAYWKDYMYFPESPRIDGDQLTWAYQIVGKGLLGSQFHEKEGVATIASKNRVLPSLNRMPSEWRRGECIYRRIDAQWFLSMCNG